MIHWLGRSDPNATHLLASHQTSKLSSVFMYVHSTGILQQQYKSCILYLHLKNVSSSYVYFISSFFL